AASQKPATLRQGGDVLEDVGKGDVQFSPQRHTPEQARLHVRQLVDGSERSRVFNQGALLRLVATHQAVNATIDEQDPVNRQMLDQQSIVLEQGAGPGLVKAPHRDGLTTLFFEPPGEMELGKV